MSTRLPHQKNQRLNQNGFEKWIKPCPVHLARVLLNTVMELEQIKSFHITEYRRFTAECSGYHVVHYLIFYGRVTQSRKQVGLYFCFKPSVRQLLELMLAITASLYTCSHMYNKISVQPNKVHVHAVTKLESFAEKLENYALRPEV